MSDEENKKQPSFTSLNPRDKIANDEESSGPIDPNFTGMKSVRGLDVKDGEPDPDKIVEFGHPDTTLDDTYGSSVGLKDIFYDYARTSQILKQRLGGVVPRYEDDGLEGDDDITPGFDVTVDFSDVAVDYPPTDTEALDVPGRTGGPALDLSNNLSLAGGENKFSTLMNVKLVDGVSPILVDHDVTVETATSAILTSINPLIRSTDDIDSKATVKAWLGFQPVASADLKNAGGGKVGHTDPIPVVVAYDAIDADGVATKVGTPAEGDGTTLVVPSSNYANDVYMSYEIMVPKSGDINFQQYATFDSTAILGGYVWKVEIEYKGTIVFKTELPFEVK